MDAHDRCEQFVVSATDRLRAAEIRDGVADTDRCTTGECAARVRTSNRQRFRKAPRRWSTAVLMTRAELETVQRAAVLTRAGAAVRDAERTDEILRRTARRAAIGRLLS